MNQQEMMQITGNIRFAGGNIQAKKASDVVAAPQQIMNEYGVAKIDVAINPWQKGPMKIKPKGPVMSLN